MAFESKRRQTRINLTPYRYDPVAFTHDMYDWGEDDGPTEYQDEALADLAEHGRLAVRGGRGSGKSSTASWAVLWFALVTDAIEEDWKCVTTAGAWSQLRHFLWPEIHYWAAKLRWDRLGRDPFDRRELLLQSINLRYGSAFAVASDRPALLEGAHAKRLFYVYDESKSVIPATFDASEGAFTGAAGTEAFALALSTPGEPAGRFYELCTQKPGYQDWKAMHIPLERALSAGRVSEAWVEQRKRQWGENSVLFANYVLGEFHSSEEESVIPLSWVEAAIDRWHLAGEKKIAPLDRIGVDVAREGADKSVIVARHGNRIMELRKAQGDLTTVTAAKVKGLLGDATDVLVTVDVDGLGAGVADQLTSAGVKVDGFHGGAATAHTDRSGELGFVNRRSMGYWKLREALDPENGPELELPPDDDLIGDLTALHWEVKEGPKQARIAVEKKDDVKARLGRSPDSGDAVVYATVPPEPKPRGRRMVAAGRLDPLPGTRAYIRAEMAKRAAGAS